MTKLWNVIFEDEFDLEFQAMSEGLQNEMLAHALLLRDYGPTLGRPTVDTLKGSKHSNMKELRFNWLNGVWRIAFAFDPKRQAVLLAAIDKAGTHKQRAYKKLIATADNRFDRYLKFFEDDKRGK
ncbi:MAG: type II toxin-antitoxin system RelE/ParE family toxin [Desulfuromonadaceae bacterium]